MAQTLFFYDYETWGTDPARNWPAQFAGIRTDADLNEIEEPINIYCRLPDDQLPDPEACMVTGLTPDIVNQKGLVEAEFIYRINTEFSRPQTCVLGYNTIRFDDEVTRYSLYRNFFDPYAREWQNGCSRWDLIDVVRLCAALRPDGINWPKKEDDTISFRLEDLTAANGIQHENAHDAVADVRATIAFAKLLRDKQPKLFDYAFQHRGKSDVAVMLDTLTYHPKRLLHVSGMFSAARNCLAVIVPLAAHPTNNNAVIVYDLAADPEPLLTLGADVLRERLYTKKEDLIQQGLNPVALKTVHLNRCPILLPLSLIKESSEQQRLDIDMQQCDAHYNRLFANPDQIRQLRQKLTAVFQSPFQTNTPIDPDHALYEGFVPNSDKALMERVRTTSPEHLASLSLPFRDKRLEELFFRYRARNWPQSLREEEHDDWKVFCRQRIEQGCGGRSLPLKMYLDHLVKLKEGELDGSRRNILEQLERYILMHLHSLNIVVDGN